MNFRKVVKFIPGLICASALAACGTSASSASTVTTAASSGSPSKGLQVLRVGQISDSIAFFPVYVARKKGYFADEGVSVAKPPLLGTGAKLAAALVGGSLDVGAGVVTDAFNLSAAGQNPKLVADLVNAYYVDIVVATNFAGPSSSASLASKIDALKGMKIGITGPGSGTQALVNYLFKLEGMNASTQSTMVNLGANLSAAVGALKTGEVNALAFFQPVAQIATATKVGKLYISPARGDVPAIDGATNGAVYTLSSILPKKQAAIIDFDKGLAKAESYIQTASTSSLVKLLAGYNSGMSKGVATSLVPILKTEIAKTPAFNKAGYNAEVIVNVKGQLVKSVPSYSTLVDGSLISKALG